MKYEHLSDFLNPDATSWGGMSLDDLRFQRALNHARREIVGAQLHQLGKELSGGQILKTTGSGIVSRLLSTLNYFDYAVLAFNIISKVRRVWPRKSRKA